MIGESMPVLNGGRGRSIFGFCILWTFVVPFCFHLASAEFALTEFALYNFNDSIIDCYGNSSLTFLNSSGNGPISLSVQGQKSDSNFCSYKNSIYVSPVTPLSTMFTFSASTPILDGAQFFNFFVATKCDNGSSGCLESSNFLIKSYILQFILFNPHGIFVNAYDFEFAAIPFTSLSGDLGSWSNNSFTDKAYVWIDYVPQSTTVEVSFSFNPQKPCKSQLAFLLQKINSFASPCVVGFYQGKINTSTPVGPSFPSPTHPSQINVWDWSVSNAGPATDIYDGYEGCSQAARLTEIIVPTSLGGLLLVGIVLGIVVLILRRLNTSLAQDKRKLENERNELLARLKLLKFGAREFTFKELQEATDNFADEIGKGGFGTVFKGTLQGVRTVAVKRINRTEKDTEDAKQLVTEVQVIGSVRHVNIVPLHGWCYKKGVMLLVYKFVDNKDLDKHLFPKTSSVTTPLAWTKRMKALRGVASALVFLHEEFESEETVIHRDIKPTNVMLDSDFNARLGDFGLARLSKRTEASHQSRCMKGTYGYIAPEYSSGATPETDVYSFGVLVLVVATARKPLDRSLCPRGQEGPGNLVTWVRNLYDQGRILEAGDETLRDGSGWSSQDSEEMTKVLNIGLCCCVYEPSNRPTMRQALTALQAPMTMFSAPLALHSPAPIAYPPFEGWSRAFESGTRTSEIVSLLGFTGDLPYVTANESFNISSAGVASS